MLLFIFQGCGEKADKQRFSQGSRQLAIQVDGYVVKTQALGENVEVPGSLIANESTEIHPEISGRIVQLNVSEGQIQATAAASFEPGP